jgi:acyl-CoA dehydrogenase
MYFLLARTGDERPSHRNLSAFLLPLKKDSPGIEPTLFEDMGRMGVSTGGFKMTDVEIPKHYLIGKENRGFYHAMEGFSNARVIIGATCLGAAEAGMNIGIDYIKQRKAFGRPIGSFEGVQFELADNYCALEADKLLTYKAAWITDKMNTEGSATHFEVAMATAIAKLRAPQDAIKILWDAQTWHGAFGYTKECSLERGVRGVRSYTIGAEGAVAIMKLVIARELLGNEYLPYRQPPQY